MKYRILLFSIFCLISCGKNRDIRIRQVSMPDGRQVSIYRMENSNGITVDVMEYGATLLSISTPDKNGNFENILAGYDSVETYFSDKSYFGCIVGRYANRISDGKFQLEGKEYNLPKNEKNINHIHGGVNGFHKKRWRGTAVNEKNSRKVTFTYTSPDGEEGYPGNLSVEVCYQLNDSNELKIDYKASTDQPTVVNLSNHSYYNLSGDTVSGIKEHQLIINADSFLAVNRNLIPIGSGTPVLNTPFDFRKPKTIGQDLAVADSQFIYANGGYDHNFILNRRNEGKKLEFALRLVEPKSGRILEMYTDQPGLQFYSGNFFDGTLKGKKGRIYKKYDALVLETQKYPDSPNHPDFPSTVLSPSQTYTHSTVLKFNILK